ncbi:MAG: hypothetical protein Gaeavirus15_11 [Gaeavirus sp.]|uniref:Uncharacterized protein n=1 Tax=Gaeavirus sp. TaxID=2487767 RepID=A0A3G5A1Y4_9VIRU|nr:MAG: hypothetical protein Gaeavirus15_11 [Gaeavirus sp.]
MNSEQLMKIDGFWQTDVWNSNTLHIYNNRIHNTISEIQQLNNTIKPGNRFYLLNTDDFEIKNNSDIIAKIDDLKKNNIRYIKTHADSIPEYHQLIISLKKDSLFITQDISFI